MASGGGVASSDETWSNSISFDDNKHQWKWNGSPTGLRDFVQSQLNLQGSGDEKNNGNQLVFKCGDRSVTINWYNKTSTLQVQGPNKDQVTRDTAHWANKSSTKSPPSLIDIIYHPFHRLWAAKRWKPLLRLNYHLLFIKTEIHRVKALSAW